MLALIFNYGFISKFVNLQPASTGTLCLMPRSQTNPKLGPDEIVISPAAWTAHRSGDKSISLVTLSKACDDIVDKMPVS